MVELNILQKYFDVIIERSWCVGTVKTTSLKFQKKVAIPVIRHLDLEIEFKKNMFENKFDQISSQIFE